MGKKYFVFDYCHNCESSFWVVCCLEKRLLKQVGGFRSIDFQELPLKERQERAIRFLNRRHVKEAWSYRGKNSFENSLFGLKLHNREGENKFFHYDFIDPKIYGDIFSSGGIELKEFRGEELLDMKKHFLMQ